MRDSFDVEVYPVQVFGASVFLANFCHVLTFLGGVSVPFTAWLLYNCKRLNIHPQNLCSFGPKPTRLFKISRVSHDFPMRGYLPWTMPVQIG